MGCGREGVREQERGVWAMLCEWLHCCYRFYYPFSQMAGPGFLYESVIAPTQSEFAAVAGAVGSSC